MTKYKAVKAHKNEYPDSITLKKGDTFTIGDKSDGIEAWDDWYYCIANNNKEGWVPKQIIDFLGSNYGVALEDYTAQELNLETDDIVIGNRQLNGWLWCSKLSSDEWGWVPLENIEQV